MARGPEGGVAQWLTTADGVRIRLGIWARPGAKGTVFLAPGRSEYIEKYGPAAADFAARGYAMLAIDWRGQGLADRVLADPVKGHVERFSDYQLDFDAVIAAAESLDLPRPWFVLGHSMGGTIVLRRLMGPHPFAACAFSAPMLGINLPRLLRPFGLPLARLIGQSPAARLYTPGMGAVTYVYREPFHDNHLTTDPAMWAFMVEHLAQVPGLTVSGPSLRWVAQSVLECAALAAAPAPDLPCYCSLGTRERIVPSAPIQDRFNHWPGARLELFDGAEHEVMMEGPQMRARFFDGCAATFDAAQKR